MSPEQLADFLNRTRARVDEALDRYLPRESTCPGIVADAMRYSVFAGGKRLRPVLTLAAADAVARRGGADAARVGADVFELALPAACAIELLAQPPDSADSQLRANGSYVQRLHAQAARLLDPTLPGCRDG